MNVNISKSQNNSNSENRNVPDFSKGDNGASGMISLDTTTKDPMPFRVEESSEEMKFFKHHQNLTGGTTEDEETDETDDDSFSWKVIRDKSTDIPSEPLLSKHIHFKPCSNQSLVDLRRESNSLLAVHAAKTTSSTVETITLSDGEANSATIFDLCLEDRHRVGKLIAELASAYEKNKQLEKKVQTINKDNEKFKQKSSNLMKKVDSLGERCHKLDNEREQLKEKHLLSLTTLQNKITRVSEQFEISAHEIQRLTMENQQMKSENKELHLKLSTQDVKLKSSEDLHLHTKSLLDASLKRERVLKSELKKISSQHKYQDDYKEDLKSRIAKQLDNSMKVQEQNKKKETSSSSVHPASKLQVPKSNFSPLSLSKETDRRNLEIDDPLKIDAIRRVDTGRCKNTDEKEEAILQDLFFRF